jgi:signal transduction histidine kinase
MKAQGFGTDRWKLGLSVFWFIFTISLVIWWWVFALQQLDLLTGVLNQHKFESLQRMLFWEGAVLVSAVFLGGLTLLVLTNRELARSQRLRSFFSNFAHDLKTSITRLRLRTEVLSEKLEGPEFEKLIMEVNRLDLQLENSLWIARGQGDRLVRQNLQLSHVIGFLRMEWPELEIKLHQDATVLADQQALKSVLRNLFQNSFLHGSATRVDVHVQSSGRMTKLIINDNGSGYSGDRRQLGVNILKSRSDKGNGLGLYLTRDLLSRMHGAITFLSTERGFSVQVELPTSIESSKASYA